MLITNDFLPTNIDSQLANMKSYVHFIKKARMTLFLRHTGYFRCSRYAKFLISHTNDIGTKPTQDMLFHLYNFDTNLRELLFHYCQIAEIQFKTYLADSLSIKLNNAAFYLEQQYYTPSRSERDKIKKNSCVRFFKSFFHKLSSDATNTLPCWVFFSYMELGTIVNIYAYLRGDLRSYVLKYGYSKSNYGKSTTKQFDTWLEALRNLRNICAHHNILVGKTSSIVLPEPVDTQTLISDTDLFSRIYALKKLLPLSEHPKLKQDIKKLIKHSKLDILILGILPYDWETRFDNISVL